MKMLLLGMTLGAVLFAAGSLLRPELVPSASAQEPAPAVPAEAPAIGDGFAIISAGTSGSWVLNTTTGAVRLCGVTGDGGVRCLAWVE